MAARLSAKKLPRFSLEFKLKAVKMRYMWALVTISCALV